jgi:hypothetical protein
MPYGGFQSAVFEFMRNIEIKEKNHSNYLRYIESLIGKLEAVVKAYKQDEKVFVAGVQKISKDLSATNDKTGK